MIANQVYATKKTASGYTNKRITLQTNLLYRCWAPSTRGALCCFRIVGRKLPKARKTVNFRQKQNKNVEQRKRSVNCRPEKHYGIMTMRHYSKRKSYRTCSGLIIQRSRVANLTRLTKSTPTRQHNPHTQATVHTTACLQRLGHLSVLPSSRHLHRPPRLLPPQLRNLL